MKPSFKYSLAKIDVSKKKYNDIIKETLGLSKKEMFTYLKKGFADCITIENFDDKKKVAMSIHQYVSIPSGSIYNNIINQDKNNLYEMQFVDFRSIKKENILKYPDNPIGTILTLDEYILQHKISITKSIIKDSECFLSSFELDDIINLIISRLMHTCVHVTADGKVTEKNFYQRPDELIKGDLQNYRFIDVETITFPLRIYFSLDNPPNKDYQTDIVNKTVTRINTEWKFKGTVIISSLIKGNHYGDITKELFTKLDKVSWGSDELEDDDTKDTKDTKDLDKDLDDEKATAKSLDKDSQDKDSLKKSDKKKDIAPKTSDNTLAWVAGIMGVSCCSILCIIVLIIIMAVSTFFLGEKVEGALGDTQFIRTGKDSLANLISNIN